MKKTYAFDLLGSKDWRNYWYPRKIDVFLLLLPVVFAPTSSPTGALLLFQTPLGVLISKNDVDLRRSALNLSPSIGQGIQYNPWVFQILQLAIRENVYLRWAAFSLSCITTFGMINISFQCLFIEASKDVIPTQRFWKRRYASKKFKKTCHGFHLSILS